MSKSEIPSIVTVIGAVLTTLGITGIDADVVSSAVQGVFAIITVIAAIVAWFKHRQVARNATSN